MTHNFSVFANSCLKVPIDPLSKMPKTAYERQDTNDQSSIDCVSTRCSTSPVDIDAEKLKDFYKSIPDYNDINHLPPEEFYTTLRILKDRRKTMLGHALDNIGTDNGYAEIDHGKHSCEPDTISASPTCFIHKSTKSKLSSKRRPKYSSENIDITKSIKKTDFRRAVNDTVASVTKSRTRVKDDLDKEINKDFTLTCMKIPQDKKSDLRPKRNHSACSITWNDAKLERDEVDQKFEQYFEGNDYRQTTRKLIDDEFKTRSMPSSPSRIRRIGSPLRNRKAITIPKPFKMTERDDDQRIVTELYSLRKSFSEDMLHQKRDRQQFKARPVPIESRIPLYDKILEDQAMRRALTKINSEAELRAQMKPFNFTKREEKALQPGLCERAANVVPKLKKKKRFRARPVPKNLFSNYIYDKMKEEEFFRTVNRRIRAEEMLRSAHLPGTMASRERSRLSTPAAHSDLPIDPSPPVTVSTDRQRARSPKKDNTKREKKMQHGFVTTSPQPFHLNTADRATKKMEDITKKIYRESKSTVSGGDSRNAAGSRAYSALELRAHAAGRSNLAALLRAEAVRRRFEMEASRRKADHRRRQETRSRDRLLRSNPAWHMVKNNHEEDIAMRLQTRRDEERMRREEFLHEMELMYGRVQQQPMLFERYYAPRSYTALDTLQLSPRRSVKKKSSRRNRTFCCNTPTSRKVSINDADGMDYLSRNDNDERSCSDSDAAIDSWGGAHGKCC